jgi:hypothetical protein
MVRQSDSFSAVRILALCLLPLLGACRDQRPPGPTAEQSGQLNDAENMLNAEAANEEGPEQRPGPSNSSD